MQKTILAPDGNVYTKTTKTFMDISDLYAYLGLTDDEIDFFGDNAWTEVSYGDAPFTLITSEYALDRMVDAYEDYHNTVIVNKSMTAEDFRNKFWQLVEKDDYINLEY
jgi:hypothetical protein